MRAIALRPSAITPALVALMLCAAVGASISVRAGYAPLLIAGAAAALFSMRWRTGVTVLLVVLPFSGVPAFFAGSAGLGWRDLCIVAPLYLAFALEMTRSRDRIVPDLGIAVPALAFFAALVLLETLRAPNALAGAIGARVWLAYIPMLAVGYHFVRDDAGFASVLKLTALLGLVPSCIAVAECALAVRDGGFGPFERMYGAWDLTETQRFVVFTTDAGNLRIPRVPSTFTGVAQYFAFSLVAYAAALALTMRDGSARWAACALLIAAGAIASGARAAYVAVPAITLVALALAGAPSMRMLALGAAGGVLCAIAAFALIDAAPIIREVPSHASVTLNTSLDELRSSLTIVGHGTGWDTNAALRYGGVNEQRYVENWYAKAMLELGAAGLIALVLAFGTLVRRLIGALRATHLPADARRMAAPIIALVAVVMVLLVKGPYVDLDPLNVYFWLLLGALFGLFRAREVAPVNAGGAR
jgi:hypothetical protein